MSNNDDWFDELLKDVNIRSKQRKNVDDDIAKNVKIKIRNVDDNNVIIVVNYDFKNGTKTLMLYPQQRLEDFLTQVTTKRDIDVLKYVVKTLKAYADMNNVLKELMTFDLDDYYKNNIKKRRVMLNNISLNVNNVIRQNDATEPQDNVNNYDEQGNVNEDNNDEEQNNNVIEQQDNNYDEQQNDNEQNDYDKQLLQQLCDLLKDLNNINLNNVNNNDELYNTANYIIQRFLTFLIDINNAHSNVINNVINYLKRHINNGDEEWLLMKNSRHHYNYDEKH